MLDNFATGNRSISQSVNQAIKSIDVVFHEAALPSVPRSINDPITSNEVNVVGTLNILDAAKESRQAGISTSLQNGVKRVVSPVNKNVFYYYETSELFILSFPCKRESIDFVLDSYFRGNDQ